MSVIFVFDFGKITKIIFYEGFSFPFFKKEGRKKKRRANEDISSDFGQQHWWSRGAREADL